MENEKILRAISDEEQVLLTKLSYLDFDIEKFEKFKFDGKKVTISDLEELLVNPKSSYLEIFDKKQKEYLGDIKLSTQLEVIQQLREKGLGDYTVIDIAKDSKINFKAIAFENYKNERGISYSGTDFGRISRDKDDNLPNYLKESPELIEAAKLFFKENHNRHEGNYIYGHSMGGNMATHVYMENYNKVDRAFTVNPVPVELEKIDDEDKIAWLSDRLKNYCHVIGGDLKNQSEDVKPYWFNVFYIKNRLGYSNNNYLSAHMLEAATYNSDGEFICDDKEIVYYGTKSDKKRKEEEKAKEEQKAKSHSIFSFEEVAESIYLKLESITEKVIGFSEKAIEKIKEIGRRMLPQDTKLLTDGSENEKQENSREAFIEGLKIDIDIFEKAIEEQREKGNPILDKTTEESKKTSTEEKGQEIGE